MLRESTMSLPTQERLSNKWYLSHGKHSVQCQCIVSIPTKADRTYLGLSEDNTNGTKTKKDKQTNKLLFNQKENL